MQQPQRSSPPTSSSMVSRGLPKDSGVSVPSRGRASQFRRSPGSRPIPSLFSPLKRLRVVFHPTETGHPVASQTHSGISDGGQLSEDAISPAVASHGKHPMGCFFKTVGGTTSSSSSASSSAVSGATPPTTSCILPGSSPTVGSCNRPISASLSDTPSIGGAGHLGGDGFGHQRCIRRLTTGMVTLSAPASPPSRIGRMSSLSLSPGYHGGDGGAFLDPHGLMHASSSPYSPCPLLFSAGSPPALSACFGTPPSLSAAQQRCCYLRFPGDEEEDSNLASASVLGSFLQIGGERSPLSPVSRLPSHSVITNEKEPERLKQAMAVNDNTWNVEKTKHSKPCASVVSTSLPMGLRSGISGNSNEEIVDDTALTAGEPRETGLRRMGKRMRSLTPDTSPEQPPRGSVPVLSFPVVPSKSETESAFPGKAESPNGLGLTWKPAVGLDRVVPVPCKELKSGGTGSSTISEETPVWPTDLSPQHPEGKTSGSPGGDASAKTLEDTLSTPIPGTRRLLDSVESTWGSQTGGPSTIADSTSSGALVEKGDDKEEFDLRCGGSDLFTDANHPAFFSESGRMGLPVFVAADETVSSRLPVSPQTFRSVVSEDTASAQLLKTPPAPLRRRTCYQRLLARAIYMGSRREVAKVLGVSGDASSGSSFAKNKESVVQYQMQKRYSLESFASETTKSEEMTADPNACIVIRLPPLPALINDKGAPEDGTSGFSGLQMLRGTVRVRDVDIECCFQEERILPLLAAARLCHAGVLQALLEGGAVVNSVNAAGQNALHLVFLKPIPNSFRQVDPELVNEEVEQERRPNEFFRGESSVPHAWVALQHFFETLEGPSEEGGHSAETESVKENKDPSASRTTPKAVQRTRCRSSGSAARQNPRLSFPTLSESVAEGNRFSNNSDNSPSVQRSENTLLLCKDPDTSAVLICADILLQHGIDSERVDVHGKTPEDYAIAFGLPATHAFFTALRKAREERHQQCSSSASPMLSPLLNAVTPQPDISSEVQDDGEKEVISVIMRTPSPPRCRRLASAHNLRDGVTALSEG